MREDKGSFIKGFSLIEVAVAITILGLIAGGMVAIFWQGSKVTDSSKKKVVAVSLAREKLEELSEDSVLPDNSGSDAYGNITGFTEFRREWNVYWADLDGVLGPDYPGNLAQIDVRVYWNNNAENISISTLEASY